MPVSRKMSMQPGLNILSMNRAVRDMAKLAALGRARTLIMTTPGAKRLPKSA